MNTIVSPYGIFVPNLTREPDRTDPALSDPMDRVDLDSLPERPSMFSLVVVGVATALSLGSAMGQSAQADETPSSIATVLPGTYAVRHQAVRATNGWIEFGFNKDTCRVDSPAGDTFTVKDQTWNNPAISHLREITTPDGSSYVIEGNNLDLPYLGDFQEPKPYIELQAAPPAARQALLQISHLCSKTETGHSSYQEVRVP